MSESDPGTVTPLKSTRNWLCLEGRRSIRTEIILVVNKLSILLVTVNSLLSLFSSTPATWNFWKTLPGNVRKFFYPNAKTLWNTRLYKFIWRSVRGLASFRLRNHESKFFWVGQFCFHNVHASPADIWMKKIDPTVSARASALAGVEFEAERQQHSTRRIWNAAVGGLGPFNFF